jgi:hypothetical protein
MDFSTMTVSGLKEYAKENNIDLGSARTKTAILSIITETKSNISAPENVIGSNKINQEKRIPKSNTKANENNVTTVGSADTFKNKVFKKDTETPEGKVALHSDKNMHWNGIGRISKGYNIVTKEAAEKWLTRKGIRQATPEEVASYYGL